MRSEVRGEGLWGRWVRGDVRDVPGGPGLSRGFLHEPPGRGNQDGGRDVYCRRGHRGRPSDYGLDGGGQHGERWRWRMPPWSLGSCERPGRDPFPGHPRWMGLEIDPCREGPMKELTAKGLTVVAAIGMMVAHGCSGETPGGDQDPGELGQPPRDSDCCDAIPEDQERWDLYTYVPLPARPVGTIGVMQPGETTAGVVQLRPGRPQGPPLRFRFHLPLLHRESVRVQVCTG